MPKIITPPQIDYPEYAKEHLAYEAKMFVATREALKQPVLHASHNTFVKNAIIESCGLHLRNLLDFFYPVATPKADDIVAAYYAHGWDGHRPNPLIPFLYAARERAHKELAHLTTKRIAGTDPKKHWDFDGHSVELRKVVTTFIEHADPSKLTTETGEALELV